MAVTVTTPGSKYKHKASSLNAKTYCGIAGAKTAQAAGPALRKMLCPACATRK